MKNKLFFFIAGVMAFLAVSCSKETAGSSALLGKTVEVKITVRISESKVGKGSIAGLEEDNWKFRFGKYCDNLYMMACGNTGSVISETALETYDGTSFGGKWTFPAIESDYKFFYPVELGREGQLSLTHQESAIGDSFYAGSFYALKAEVEKIPACELPAAVNLSPLCAVVRVVLNEDRLDLLVKNQRGEFVTGVTSDGKVISSPGINAEDAVLFSTDKWGEYQVVVPAAEKLFFYNSDNELTVTKDSGLKAGSYSTLVIGDGKSGGSIVTGGPVYVNECAAKIYGWNNIPGTNLYGIEYSCTDLTTGALTVMASSKDGENKFYCELPNLESGSLYYYRAFAVNGGLREYGKIRTFNTHSLRAYVTTLDADNITESGCTMNGKLIVDSYTPMEVNCRFLYSDSASDLESLKKTGTSSADLKLNTDGTFKMRLGYLGASKKIYYVACARINNEDFYGEVKSLITEEVPIVTLDATDVKDVSFWFKGAFLRAVDPSLVKKCGFLYSEDKSELENKIRAFVEQASYINRPEPTFNEDSWGLSEDNSFFARLLFASVDRTYYYAAGTVVYDYSSIKRYAFFGEIKSVKTKDLHVTITSSADNVTIKTASLQAQYTVEDGLSPSADYSYAYSFVFSDTYSTMEDLIASGTVIRVESVNFRTDLTDLTPNTTYYYVPCVNVSGKNFYGEVKTFTTFGGNFPTNEIIDMGLSVKWRGWNLGASKPEELGDYYAFGELTGYLDGKTDFSMETYKWANADEHLGGDPVPYEYPVQGKLGGKWSMPVESNFKELLSNTTYEETEINGTKGIIFFSNINGNCVFFPYAGMRVGTALVKGNGYYWCSGRSYYRNWFVNRLFILEGSRAYPYTHIDMQDFYRYRGLSIRPVLKD